MHQVQVCARTGLEIQVERALLELSTLDAGHPLPNLLVASTPWGNRGALWGFAGTKYGHYDYERRATQSGNFYKCPFALRRLLDEVRLAIGRIKRFDGGQVKHPERAHGMTTH